MRKDDLPMTADSSEYETYKARTRRYHRTVALSAGAELQLAATLAMGGYGVEDVRVKSGVDMSTARLLVLGVP